MAERGETVFVVDDDEAVRDAVSLLLRSAGLGVATFDNAEAFLEALDPQASGCLLLDIRMPGLDGMQLQQMLADRGCALPVIFITGHGDVPLAVQAMRRGALEFLQKPFDDAVLLERIEQAFALDRQNRRADADFAAVRERLQSLTPREGEVLELLIDGMATKQIAYELGVSPRTAEIHRGRIMEKMASRSLAELVRAVLDVRARGS